MSIIDNRSPLNILFVINEAAPIYKIGGLGDVGGSLPPALRQLDVDVRLALPKHPEINLADHDCVFLESFSIVYNQIPLTVNLYQTLLPQTNVPLYLFEETKYISKTTGSGDNYADKYAVFSLAVASWIAHTQNPWHPKIVHLHDWHTALIPVILKHSFSIPPILSLITIHNLEYMGQTKAPIVQRLNLPQNACQILSWDQADGDLNILLEGILHSDLVTTVSPQYAQEILTAEYGAHIESIMQTKIGLLRGILNGLDINYFNPETDPFLDTHYNVDTVMAGKLANKQTLQRHLELPQSSVPMVSYIGRVDGRQKGIDLIIDAFSKGLFPLKNMQFVFLGTGDPSLETSLHQLTDHLESVRVITRFDETLAHQIYAGSDILLIPSRYEPCGLVQMIAQRYGALPLARSTGGLKDTIVDNQTGFLFHEYTTSALVERLTSALNTLTDLSTTHPMIQKAMSIDYSWTKSAGQYLLLYRQLLNNEAT
jgi:starch synthase